VTSVSATKSIPVHTACTSLLLNIEPDGSLVHAYLGSRLEDPDAKIPERSLLGERMSVFEVVPCFGGRYDGEPALRVTHADGGMTTELRVQEHRQRTLEANVIETEITLSDEAYAFDYTLIYRAYQDEDIITVHSRIQHQESGPVKLHSFDSGFLTARAQEIWLTHFSGGWASEMQLQEEKLHRGIKLIDSKDGVRTSQRANPSFVLSLGASAQEEYGEVIGGALAWSGNYRMRFEVDARDRLQVSAGMNPFASDYRLEPGSVFETPELAFSYSDQGKGLISRRFHRWIRRYRLRHGDVERPVLLNSWEGVHFDFDEDDLITMMTGAAEVGVELFVLDDGWFGNASPRNSPKAGLGDWQVNASKLPRGIGHLLDHADQLGINFGIWVEPEMVNPDSDLARTHPEWIVQRPRREMIPMRHQYLLDLANPEVQDFVFGVVDHLLTEHPRISYIKWDCNRHVQNFGSPYLPADQQSHWWIKSTQGLYAVYDRLSRTYPEVTFQACASGGGRVDLGSMTYHDEFWTSDNTDALTRIFQQWSTSHFYPAIAMASHVSESPNRQTGNESSLKKRFDVAMSGRLGLELRPELLNQEDLERTRACVDLYKRIRPVIQFGDLYRLVSPYKQDVAALMMVAPDRSRAVVFCYGVRFQGPQAFPLLRLRGLDPSRTYRVNEINPDSEQSVVSGDGELYGGEILMKAGIELMITRATESAVVELVAIQNGASE
jgi:alpha-galactosidase